MLMKYLESGNYVHVKDEDKELLKEMVIEENIPLGRQGGSNPDKFFNNGQFYNYIIYDYETHGLLWSSSPSKNIYEFKELLSEINMPEINIDIDEFI